MLDAWLNAQHWNISALDQTTRHFGTLDFTLLLATLHDLVWRVFPRRHFFPFFAQDTNIHPEPIFGGQVSLTCPRVCTTFYGSLASTGTGSTGGGVLQSSAAFKPAFGRSGEPTGLPTTAG